MKNGLPNIDYRFSGQSFLLDDLQDGEGLMICTCGGKIERLYSPKQPVFRCFDDTYYAKCNKCLELYTWKEYQELQVDRLIQAAREGKF